METNFDDEDQYHEAKKRVEMLKGFYGNLLSFIIVNIFLIAINLYTSPNHLWFYWPLLWWGIGVVFHGFKVFGVFPHFGKEWEEKKINEIMEKGEKQNKQMAIK